MATSAGALQLSGAKGAPIEPLVVRHEAFLSVVRFLLGPRLGQGSIWNLRTQLLTLASCQLVQGLATELGLEVEEWLFADGPTPTRTPLEGVEAC